MRWLLAADRTHTPWKNGGGLTWTIASDHADASLADFKMASEPRARGTSWPVLNGLTVWSGIWPSWRAGPWSCASRTTGHQP